MIMCLGSLQEAAERALAERRAREEAEKAAKKKKKKKKSKAKRPSDATAEL